MSAIMAKQGGWVQLELSNMHLAYKKAEIAKEGFSCATMEEMQYQIKQLCSKLQEQEKRSIEFSGHQMVNGTMERLLAMVRENQTNSCIPCQYGTAQRP